MNTAGEVKFCLTSPWDGIILLLTILLNNWPYCKQTLTYTGACTELSVAGQLWLLPLCEEGHHSGDRSSRRLPLCSSDLPAERHRGYPGSEATLPPRPAWPFWSRALLRRTKDAGSWMNEWKGEWINSGISLKQMSGGIPFTETHRCLPHNPQWTSWSETWQSELRRKKRTTAR